MYRVWYLQNGELYMASCGNDLNYALKILEAYYPDYFPWLEYISLGYYKIKGGENG